MLQDHQYSPPLEEITWIGKATTKVATRPLTDCERSSTPFTQRTADGRANTAT